VLVVDGVDRYDPEHWDVAPTAVADAGRLSPWQQPRCNYRGMTRTHTAAIATTTIAAATRAGTRRSREKSGVSRTPRT